MRKHTTFLTTGLVALTIVLILLSLPTLFIWKENYMLSRPVPPSAFPVTVNPKTKTIAEDPAIDAMLAGQNTPLSAAVSNASEALDLLASAIASIPLYETLTASKDRLVVIDPGYRKEQVAAVFGRALDWNQSTQTLFLDPAGELGLSEGFVSPGTYVVNAGGTTDETRREVTERFNRDILSHYGTSTQAIVPLSQALTIASMIERETNDKGEMRMISGIIWNRIFNGMKLQIDATVQYAKGTSADWWPPVRPKDTSINSPYNTYLNVGLPPAPISNPSVAAVLAALNPKNTSCLFYFHDKYGGFHCSDTYAQHVSLLKKYYGQGK